MLTHPQARPPHYPRERDLGPQTHRGVTTERLPNGQSYKSKRRARLANEYDPCRDARNLAKKS